MRRFHRPILLYGLTIAAAEVLFAASGEGMSLISAALIFAASSAFCMAIVGMSSRSVQAFIDGLEAGGLRTEIVSDEIGWSGERKVRLSTPAGTYHVESSIGTMLHLRFRSPSTFGWQQLKPFGAHGNGRKEAAKVTHATWSEAHEN